MRSTSYLMESYIDSTIGVEEKNLLSQRMKQNPELARELAFRRELNQMAHEDDVGRLREKLHQAHRLAYEDSSLMNRFANTRTRRLFYAAATAAGIALGGWAILTGGEYGAEPAELYREYFTPYPSLAVFREQSALDFGRGYVKAMSLYQASNYAGAAVEFESLLALNPSSATVRFYLGVTCMKLNDFQKSITLFNDVIEGDNLLTEQAIWYKGLSYLALEEIPKALETFASLKRLNTPYGVRAAKLIDKLDNKNNND